MEDLIQMKVVILAGGRGTRISEETLVKPKPMVEIGDAPILWHIMKTYSHYGYNDFLICLGYKGYVIKEYFANYYRHMADAITYDFNSENRVEVLHTAAEPWSVTLVETGLNTMTGGRVKRMQPFTGDEPFLLTYGDGVADVDVAKLVRCHEQSHRLATVTAVQPEGRFGRLQLSGNTVTGFSEKVRGEEGWINGGYMVFQPEVYRYLQEGDQTILEQEPLKKLAQDGQLNAYRHDGFWQPMDTLREKNVLNQLWESNHAPWKVWDD